jgi:hypothetical protein
MFDTPRLAPFALDWTFRRYLNYLHILFVALLMQRAVDGCGCGPIECGQERLNRDMRAGAVPVGRSHVYMARMSERPSARL